jgi:hypothetical protein
MSDELLLNKNMNNRVLRQEERAVIEALLNNWRILGSFTKFLDQARVTDMQDGGMGSIRFEPYASRRYGKTLAEAQYTDVDGVLVSITLNADEYGNLFEMDFWKVDFSPLSCYPKACDLEFKKFGAC